MGNASRQASEIPPAFLPATLRARRRRDLQAFSKTSADGQVDGQSGCGKLPLSPVDRL